MSPYIANLLEALGLGTFIYYLFRGLKTKIKALEKTIEIQNVTLNVMERRVQETEKVGGIYKNLMSDLPQDLENFKTILSKTKDDLIIELQKKHQSTKEKLEEAENRLKESGKSQDILKNHLTVLRNLLSLGERGDLVRLSEFSYRKAEDAVPLIIESKTLDEYLTKYGYRIEIRENDSIIKETLDKYQSSEKTNLKPLEARVGEFGWMLLVGDELYLDHAKLSKLKDDFSRVKTINA